MGSYEFHSRAILESACPRKGGCIWRSLELRPTWLSLAWFMITKGRSKWLGGMNKRWATSRLKKAADLSEIYKSCTWGFGDYLIFERMGQIETMMDWTFITIGPWWLQDERVCLDAIRDMHWVLFTSLLVCWPVCLFVLFFFPLSPKNDRETSHKSSCPPMLMD